jgi:hypothetical protein
LLSGKTTIEDFESAKAKVLVDDNPNSSTVVVQQFHDVMTSKMVVPQKISTLSSQACS